MSLPLSGLLSDSTLLEELLRFIPEGLTIATAPDVEILAVSDFGRQLTGRTERDLIGEAAEQHPTSWQIYHLDGRTLARPEELPLTRATVEGEVVVNEPWILRKPDGTDLHILCNAGPIRDATGAIRWGIIAWRDVTALHEAEAALAREREQAARAHEALLAEAHHRIKNNLTLVASMLRLEARAAETEMAREQFRKSANRVFAIGQLYDLLQTGDGLGLVDLETYLQELVRTLTEALQQPEQALTIAVEADPCPATVTFASALGIIVNELITNSVKHGSAPDGSCTIRLRFKHSPGQLELCIQDEGVGLPPDFSLDQSKGLGMRFVASLVGTHHGVWRVETHPKRHLCIAFPPAAAQTR